MDQVLWTQLKQCSAKWWKWTGWTVKLSSERDRWKVQKGMIIMSLCRRMSFSNGVKSMREHGTISCKNKKVDRRIRGWRLKMKSGFTRIRLARNQMVERGKIWWTRLLNWSKKTKVWHRNWTSWAICTNWEAWTQQVKKTHTTNNT